MNCTIREVLISLTVILKITFESREENGLITFCFPKGLYFTALLQASF